MPVTAGGRGETETELGLRPHLVSQMIILPGGKDIVDVVAGEPEPKSDITSVS
jgi:hypothetical protein